MQKEIELLSPAGSMDALKAAINGGANAVYLGLDEFSARKRAKNFSLDELKEALDLAHNCGVKVYVAFNTLVKDKEFKGAIKTLENVVNAGVDGVIVQDLGLLDALLKLKREGGLENFSIQLSTQASVYAQEGFKFFEDKGLDRIVVARETGLEDIKGITESEKAETKIFGHGALCYAYSGQCHLSSSIGARSGNRGGCAQPCRKHYTLYKDGEVLKDGFLLSTKELCSLERIGDLERSGIDSIKIEGRMRSPEYVYATTKAYRDALDGQEPYMGDIETAFSRDFTQGLLFNSRHNLSQEKPKKRGKVIGMVGEVDGDVVELVLDKGVRLINGDGLSFGSAENVGFNVSGMYDEEGKTVKEGTGSVWVYSPRKLSEGMVIHRSFDKEAMDRLKRQALKKPEKTKVPVEMSVQLMEWSVPILTISDGLNEATVMGEEVLEGAKNVPATDQDVINQLSRLGGTDFELTGIDVDMDEGLFIPKSVLNSLRQEAVSELERARSRKAQTEILEIKPSKVSPRANKGKRLFSVRFDETPDDGLIKNLGADEIVLTVKDFSDLKPIESLIEEAKKTGLRVLVTVPTVMHSQLAEELKNSDFLDLVDKDDGSKADGFLVPNYELLNILVNSPKREEYIEADESLNVFNAHSVEFLKDTFVDAIVLSEELESKEIRELAERSPLSVTMNVAGKRRLMISKNCVMDCMVCDGCANEGWYDLENSHHDQFLLKIENGLNYIYNSETTQIPKALREQPNVDKFRFNVTNEDDEEVLEIAGNIKKALNGEIVELEVKPDNYRMEVE